MKAGEWSAKQGGNVAAGGIELVGASSAGLVAKGGERATELPGGAGLVVMDTEVTPELAAEGRPATSSGSSSRRAGRPVWTWPTGSR